MTWKELIERCPSKIYAIGRGYIAVKVNHRIFYFFVGGVIKVECLTSQCIHAIARHRTYEQMLMIMEALK